MRSRKSLVCQVIDSYVSGFGDREIRGMEMEVRVDRKKNSSVWG